jgi:multidrug transporter EmrE-like cation transporter
MMSQNAFGVFLVVIYALLEGVAQVFLKKSVLGSSYRYLWISLGVVILLIEKMIYSEALLFLDVGAAYTIGGLNLIAVTFMSRCLLRQKVTRKRWIGVCLIFVGVGLVAART